jgi:FHS family L-fucose permease-like MFS transporter
LQIYRVHEASSVKLPYLYIALALMLLGLAIAIFKLPRIEQTQDFRPGAGHTGDSIWKYRHIGSAILQRFRAGTLLGIAAILAGLLVAISMLSFGSIAIWSMLLVGLCNSIMFPTIFTLGIAELGPLTGKGSGLLVTAIVGAAIIPVAEGALADHIGIHHAFILPILCYVFIAYYGYRGSRPVRIA